MIKIYPTAYNGLTFRSRNEARWARFFDLIEEPWQYEPQRFELRHGSYLPDFLLPSAYSGRGMWIECKPMYPSDLELWLLYELAETTGQKVAVVWGAIGDFASSFDLFVSKRTGSRCYWAPTIAMVSGMTDDDDTPYLALDDVSYEPCRCRRCNTFGFEFEARGGRICREACGRSYDDGGGDGFCDEFRIAQRYDFARHEQQIKTSYYRDGEPDLTF